MSPYLASSYAAAAYANGIVANGGSSLSRSPLFYPDALSSPPPAHMSAAAVAAAGLRPPLYHLPHSQYPYSAMLGPEQIAAWHHHQASMYQVAQAQAGALRSNSPYSLPITSSSISPMSRFSPGLLGPHAAAAAAAGLAGPAGLSPGAAHHLPHHLKQEFDGRHSSQGGQAGDKAGFSPGSKKPKEPHVKKPLNAFMLYMKEKRPQVQAECTLKESAAINQILGRRWHALSRDEQAKYYEMARKERQIHMQLYPGWTARDNYAKHKKKRRKKDTIRDGAASMKKCRARFGLDRQDEWCKPCRRKKKCIQVQMSLDRARARQRAQEGGAGGTGDGEANGTNGETPSSLNDEGGPGSDGAINSDEYDQDDDSPDGTGDGGPDSVESASEQSLASPAAFSLGSPSGSIASPSTPASVASSIAAAANAAAFEASLGGGGVSGGHSSSSTSDWFRGAFRPVPSSPSSSIPYLHHRSPVGTDPRDPSHPLCVSQLTSKPIVASHLPPPPGALPSAGPGSDSVSGVRGGPNHGAQQPNGKNRLLGVM